VTLSRRSPLAHADAVVAARSRARWPTVLRCRCGPVRRGIYRAANGTADDLRASITAELPLLKWDTFQKSWLYRMYFQLADRVFRALPHPWRILRGATYYRVATARAGRRSSSPTSKR